MAQLIQQMRVAQPEYLALELLRVADRMNGLPPGHHAGLLHEKLVKTEGNPSLAVGMLLHPPIPEASPGPIRRKATKAPRRLLRKHGKA